MSNKTLILHFRTSEKGVAVSEVARKNNGRMSRVAVIVHSRAKAVALFYVALPHRELSKALTVNPSKSQEITSLIYKCPFVQDRLVSGSTSVRICRIDICSD